MTMNDQDQQSSQITKVISLGKEQGYLTYSQINDLLPNIVDTEHFDVIISMLEGMNIKVFELPPSEDELALLLNTEEVPDIEEAAMVLAPCGVPAPPPCSSIVKKRLHAALVAVTGVRP